MKRNDDALLKEARDRYNTGVENDRKNREDMSDDMAFLSGEQWDEATRKEREADNRIMLTENRLPLFVAQIVGDIRQQKPAIRVRGIDDDADKDVAEIFTGLIRDIEARSSTRQPLIRAAETAVQCGIGHFRILTDYAHAKTNEQDIFMQPIHDPLAVVWDPDARLVTREDAMWCHVTTRMSEEAFKTDYPEAKLNGFNADEPQTPTYSDWFGEDGIMISEYWVKEPYTYRLGTTQTGEVHELGKDADESLYADIRERKSYRVRCYKMTATEILSVEDWPTPHIPIIPVIGEELQVGKRIQRRGVIRNAKDAQVRLNYWLTTQTEWLALQPKAPFIGTAEQIKGYEADWAAANDTQDAILVYNADPKAPGPPQRAMPPTGSSGFHNEILMATDALKATTGIFDASMGAQSNETSGRAIRERKMQASTANYAYIDNLSKSVEYAGRILIDLIPLIYDTKRTIRILGEDGAERYETVNQIIIENGAPVEKNNLAVGRYDVSVSTGPSYSTKRSEAAESMLQFIQTAPDIAVYIIDILAENMDWPKSDEVTARLKKMPQLAAVIEPDDDDEQAQMQMAQQAQAAQQQQQMAEMAAQLEMAKMQAEIAKLQQESAKTGAEVEETIAKTAETVADTMLKRFEIALKGGAMTDALTAARNMPAPAQIEQQVF
jgi:hypothetical protein